MARPAKAQTNYELTCPSGSFPQSGGVSYDPATNSYRAFVCSNSAGMMTWNDAVTSSVSFPLKAPNGTQAAPSYSWNAATGNGLYWGTGKPCPIWAIASTDVWCPLAAGQVFSSGATVMWASGTSLNSAFTVDTNLSRDSAGVIDVGASASQGDKSGSMKMTNLTLTGTCTGCGGGGRSAFVTSTYTNATGTATNITGLSFSLSASTNYSITCVLVVQNSTTTGTLLLTPTGPASPTAIAETLNETLTTGALSTYADWSFHGSSYSVTSSGTGITTGTDLRFTFTNTIINGTNAGTWQLEGNMGGSSDTVTVQTGSSCISVP